MHFDAFRQAVFLRATNSYFWRARGLVAGAKSRLREFFICREGQRAVLESAGITSGVNLAYDIAVVGGGINGVGLARDAAGRGLRVCWWNSTTSHRTPHPPAPSSSTAACAISKIAIFGSFARRLPNASGFLPGAPHH